MIVKDDIAAMFLQLPGFLQNQPKFRPVLKTVAIFPCEHHYRIKLILAHLFHQQLNNPTLKVISHKQFSSLASLVPLFWDLS